MSFKSLKGNRWDDTWEVLELKNITVVNTCIYVYKLMYMNTESHMYAQMYMDTPTVQ